MRNNYLDSDDDTSVGKFILEGFKILFIVIIMAFFGYGVQQMDQMNKNTADLSKNVHELTHVMAKSNNVNLEDERKKIKAQKEAEEKEQAEAAAAEDAPEAEEHA